LAPDDLITSNAPISTLGGPDPGSAALPGSKINFIKGNTPVQINPFANGAAGIGPNHPLHLNVNVRLLNDPVRSIAMAALDAGNLSCHTDNGRASWVFDAQLAAIVGFGRKLNDPGSPYFVPPEAKITPCFLPERIRVNSPFYHLKALADARLAADYLTNLSAAMPPRPYDLHVHRDAEGTPLASLAKDGSLDLHPSDRGWWVSSVQLLQRLPAGESLYDPASAWYVDPHDWADHDAVDEFLARHRRQWPEIYDSAEG
jgi:hypothetical protein